MKRTTNRAVSFVIVLAIVVSLFAGMLTTSATGYTANWGKRGTLATSPSSKASSYYTGSYSYATLSSLSGSTSSSAASIYASPLGTALHNLSVNKQTTTTSYDGTKSLYKYTDCENGNTGTISSFYSGTNMDSDWGSGWNREHTWPNSKGLNGSDENDIMMLRPTANSENGSRGNKAYGESSGFYDPNSESNGKYNLRGDVARLMLQHMIRWGNINYMFGSGGVMESRAVLLKWMEEDPVDTWELGRNDAVQSITGVRNVFVDYPELAFRLLGVSVPENYSTPSNPTGATQPTDPTQPTTPTGDEYVLTSSLKSGDKVILFNKGNGKALMGEMTGYYVAGADVTVTDGKITTDDTSFIWTATKNPDGSFKFTQGSNTLSTDSSVVGDKTYYNLYLDGTGKSNWTLESANTAEKLFWVYSSELTGSFGNVYLEWYASKAAFSAYDASTSKRTEQDFGIQFYVLTEGGSEPTEPTEPTTPTTPTEPTEPTTPTTPTTPTDPTEPTTSCSHTYVETKVGATCSQPGYTLHTCSKCGDYYRSDFTATLSHSFSGGICVNCGTADPDYVDPAPDIPYSDSALYASYADLEKEAWYRAGIVYVLHQGLMNGVGNEGEHIFDPDGKVTRAMVVTILYRAAGSPNAKGLALPFEDVETGSWYTSAVAWAADQGIVLGVSDTEFDPHSPITREQLAAVLYRYAGEPAALGNLTAYIDAKDVSQYALSALKWAIGEKIVTGIDNRLAPQETATRAQIATVFFRYLDPVAAKEAQELLENNPNPYD
ncbi:MAG: S-layer homology domain-containing protein [Faecousia sp.]